MILLLALAIPAYALKAHLSTAAIDTSTRTRNLNKKSTALDVLKALNRDGQLAPYVGPEGVAVVTGGSSGIGLPTVTTLALTGMKVVLCARDTEAAHAAIQRMDSSCDKGRIRVQKLDLADLNSVRSAVEEIRRTEGNIDLLVNNAGVMAIQEKQLTQQNFEMQLGTNHIGHFYLSRLLLPFMTEGGRVVTVASTAHTMARNPDLDDLNYETRTYRPWNAYGQSKLANVLFGSGLQDKLREAGSDILSVSLHPGVIQTNLWRHTENFLFRLVSGLIMDKTVDQGAATNVFCSLANANQFNGGDYVADCQIAQPDSVGKDENKRLRNKLWVETESMIKGAGFDLPEKLV